MHQKISYEIFSERGKYHEEQGKENQDAINVVTNGNYVFAILSDGAGSSRFAKDSAQLTVDAASRFCSNNREHIFESSKSAARDLVSFIQKELIQLSGKYQSNLSEMKSTLLVLGINIQTKKYVTIHIGDGMMLKIKDSITTVLSYPENDITPQYTYTVCSDQAMKHFRIDNSSYEEGETFLICSDGLYCNNNLFGMLKRGHLDLCSDDDVSYCIINT